jgi:hypothetical protein
VLKNKSVIVLFLLAVCLVITYQNCGQTDEQSGLFGSHCNDGNCNENPQALSLQLDLQLVPGGTFKISTNPSAGFKNLRLTGTCNLAGFTKTLVKAKIYQCVGSNCSTLKYIDGSACSPEGRFQIESAVTNLTPGPHKLNLEMVGLDDFGQEVYGPKSKLSPINMTAQATIKPPVLATFVGANEWAVDKVYYEEATTTPNKIVLDGHIQGFCDYNASTSAANKISVKLAFHGDSKYTLLATATCTAISGNANALNSPNRAGRTGFFDIPSFSLYYSYGQNLATCLPNDADCLNNSLNMWTSRLISLSFFQNDATFDYDVSSTRNLALHFKNIAYGNGWMADALQETLKRIKKSFNFSGLDYSGALSAAQNPSDFTTAVKILTSAPELYDPLANASYGYGTRAFMVKWLLNATEDISASLYNTTNIYFLGTSTTLPYKQMALGSTCGLNPSLADPISGVVGAQYSTDPQVERIAACLGFRYLDGLWNRPHTDVVKMVTLGVTYLSPTTCKYRDGGAIASRDCTELLSLLEFASKMKTRFMNGVSFSSATDTQLKYFANGLTQKYIDHIMANLLYRNASGENEYFAALFQLLYPTVTDDATRRLLYPDEINYIGATPAMRFYGTRTKQLPDGSYVF